MACSAISFAIDPSFGFRLSIGFVQGYSSIWGDYSFLTDEN